MQSLCEPFRFKSVYLANYQMMSGVFCRGRAMWLPAARAIKD